MVLSEVRHVAFTSVMSEYIGHIPSTWLPSTPVQVAHSTFSSSFESIVCRSPLGASKKSCSFAPEFDWSSLPKENQRVLWAKDRENRWQFNPTIHPLHFDRLVCVILAIAKSTEYVKTRLELAVVLKHHAKQLMEVEITQERPYNGVYFLGFHEKKPCENGQQISLHQTLSRAWRLQSISLWPTPDDFTQQWGIYRQVRVKNYVSNSFRTLQTPSHFALAEARLNLAMANLLSGKR